MSADATAPVATRPEDAGHAAGQRPSATPRLAPPATDDEVELWWGGFAARTMLPSFLGCVLVTAAAGGLAWKLWCDHLVAGGLARSAVYALAAAVWSFQLFRWGYRVVARNYRLTTRRLFHEQGFLYPPDEPVDLAAVARVLAEQSLMERLLGVGQVRVVLENGTALPLVLEGVRDPVGISRLIQDQARQARERNVVALRV